MSKRKVGSFKEEQVQVRVLKPFGGHVKGDKIMVAKRKTRDSSRPIKRGIIKPV